MLGVQVTKDQINQSLAQTFSQFKLVLIRFRETREWVEAQTDAALTELGFDANEIALLRSAVADAAQIYAIFVGAATLDTPKDFRAFIKQLWGMGA